MRILFLDVDGVLIPVPFLEKRQQSNRDEMNPEAVLQLNRVTDTTGAALVLSSSWRIRFPYLSDVRGIFKAQGITGKLVGRTQCLSSRAVEIQTWVACSVLPVQSFAVVDDDGDMDGLLPLLVQTKSSVGLTESDANTLIRILSEDL